MPNLYVITQGTKLRLSGASIYVMLDEKQLDEIELLHIERVILYGNVQITTQTIKAVTAEDKTIHLLNFDGNCAARILPMRSKDSALRMKQFQKCTDETFKMSFYKNLLQAKIYNCIAVTQRFESHNPETKLDALQDKLADFIPKIVAANNVNEILGYEGAAADVYFDAFAAMLSDNWDFSSRRKHPPTDEVNAVLSLTYTLVSEEIAALLEAVGFDSYFGFVHTIDYGRNSLAQDMIEVFRAPVADRFVLRMLNKNMLSHADFEHTESGVFLTHGALRKFIHEYEKFLLAEFNYKTFGETSSLRRIFQLQVEQIQRYVKDEDELKFFDFRKY